MNCFSCRGNIQPGQQSIQSHNLVTSGAGGIAGTPNNLPAVEQPSSSTVVQPSLPACKIVQTATPSDFNVR